MSSVISLPLVYACSGCSNVAQLANDCAIRLDREGWAEMSCISGVGGGVAPLVQLARAGRPILALDGCALGCVAACLDKAGVTATKHLILRDSGIRKRFHTDSDEDEMDRAWRAVTAALSELNSEHERAG